MDTHYRITVEFDLELEGHSLIDVALEAAAWLQARADNDRLDRLVYKVTDQSTGQTHDVDLEDLDRADDLRECDDCGDEVQTLSSRDLCDACEALTPCSNCGERHELRDLTESNKMCDSCVHNARRSGAFDL